LRKRLIEIEGYRTAIREAGDPDKPAFVLLHGWPQSADAYDRVAEILSRNYRVLVPDLPGIGDSPDAPPKGDKRLLAGIIRKVILSCGLTNTVVVGHDVGGQIVFSMLRNSPGGLAGAVIMSVAVPGVEPWDSVIRNPRIWHFAFHNVPDLPEKLVAGNQHAYFDFFFDALSKQKSLITSEARDRYAAAYARPESLKAGFDWYRAFARDAEDSARSTAQIVDVPVLYLRGSAETGELSEYLQGLRAAGLSNVEADAIPDSGHFTLDENPDAVAERLVRFRQEIG
jgi:pimeloyl-ACP methyl ester carboxylesterase